MTIQLDLVTARLFVAIAEEGSIGRAARRESIVPSAVSKRISEFEQRLGIPLLKRHHNGVELTASGLAVLRHASKLLHQSGQLASELKELATGFHGHVRICASETTLVGYLPPILGAFLKAYPGVSLELEEMTNSQIVQAVQQQAADIGIFAGEAPPENIWIRACYRDCLVAVMPPDHPLAYLPALRLEHLFDHQLIAPKRRGSLETLLNRQAAQHGRTTNIRVSADGFDVVCRLVQQNLGVGLLSESSAELFAPPMQLVIKRIEGSWATREHRICVRDPDQLAPAARLLLDHLATAIASHAQGISIGDVLFSKNRHR